MSDAPVPPPEAIREMSELVSKGLMVQALSVVARLEIADLLRDRPKSAEELASASGAHASILYRLLRALTGLGIFTQDQERRFGLTPLGRTLCSGPGSTRERAAFVGEPWVWNAWGSLYDSVMTGEPAFWRTHGMRLFEYLERNPDAGASFHRNLSRQSDLQVPFILAAYGFSGFQKLVDVGGGHGSLLTAILLANPTLTGVLYDLPEVVAGAEEVISASRISERVEIVGGTFFESVPAGGDCYLLKLVIHDWDDERALRVLRNARAAIGDGGKLLLLEFVMPPGDAFHHAKFMDLSISCSPRAAVNGPKPSTAISARLLASPSRGSSKRDRRSALSKASPRSPSPRSSSAPTKEGALHSADAFC